MQTVPCHSACLTFPLQLLLFHCLHPPIDQHHLRNSLISGMAHITSSLQQPNHSLHTQLIHISIRPLVTIKLTVKLMSVLALGL